MNVFLHVGQNVHERVPDLPRCREHPCVVAIAPYGASSAERAIAGLRCADRQTLDAAREPLRLVRFDEKMHMVALDGEVQETEHATRRCGERG